MQRTDFRNGMGESCLPFASVKLPELGMGLLGKVGLLLASVDPGELSFIEWPVKLL